MPQGVSQGDAMQYAVLTVIPFCCYLLNNGVVSDFICNCGRESVYHTVVFFHQWSALPWQFKHGLLPQPLHDGAVTDIHRSSQPTCHTEPVSLAVFSSSSTPTVPLSSSELLYGNGEGSGRSGPGQGHGGEDVAAGDIGAWDHRTHDKQKLKELELHGNKRPPSRNNSNRRVPNFDKGQYIGFLTESHASTL